MISVEDLDFVADLARDRAGLMLRGEKVFFIQSRLGGLARRENEPTVQALLQRLRAHHDEALALAVVEAMAAPETSFFRDKAPFERLADQILPELAAARPRGEVRLWSAGCSTGQEAYSLAMLADRARAKAPNIKLSILGTDISERALEKARTGLYTQFEVQRGLPIRMLLQHFERVDDNWRANPRLRQAVQWKRLNLLGDVEGQGLFDVVLCRNVLSYLDSAPRAEVVGRVVRAVAEGGYLILGKGEDGDLPDAFDPPLDGVIHRRSPASGRVAA